MDVDLHVLYPSAARTIRICEHLYELNLNLVQVPGPPGYSHNKATIRYTAVLDSTNLVRSLLTHVVVVPGSNLVTQPGLL
eukprot:SAG31_NODE_645_length_13244_cov_11.768903_1_plen_80_part_00